jgi:putative transposase
MCTLERQDHFSDVVRTREIVEQLLSTAAHWGVEIIAYCFMPDHLHVLVEGMSEQANSREFADAFRQISGFHFKQARGRRLWQEGYYDHVVREEEDTIAVARYIVLNPVRAALCADASEYALLGSTRYELPELMTAVDWYPPSGCRRRRTAALG